MALVGNETEPGTTNDSYVVEDVETQAKGTASPALFSSRTRVRQTLVFVRDY